MYVMICLSKERNSRIGAREIAEEIARIRART